MDTQQRSTAEKDLVSKRAHLRKRAGVLDEEEQKIQRDKKKMKNLLTTAGLVRDTPFPRRFDSFLDSFLSRQYSSATPHFGCNQAAFAEWLTPRELEEDRGIALERR